MCFSFAKGNGGTYQYFFCLGRNSRRRQGNLRALQIWWAGGTHSDSRLRLASLIAGRLSNGSPDRELAAVVGSTGPLAQVIPLAGRSAPAAPAPKPGTASGTVFQLKITLQDTKPPIWRRVLVDGSATLDHVHDVIQAAFGWWNYHLHEFEVGRTRYGVPDPDEDWGEPPRGS